MKKLVLDFSKYTIVGIIVTIITISLTWFLIDIGNLHTILATSLVVVLAHLIKFYSYKKIKLFNRRQVAYLQFTLYTVIVFCFSILHIVLVWFLIDILYLRTLLSVTVVTVGIFLARFISFKIANLITDKD
ncbi:MAG: hypothetical protein KAS76_00230 [Thermoplasmatales archaeon]|nr:hypothetical protein [Thermoplasmatales archaeon]